MLHILHAVVVHTQVLSAATAQS